MVRVFGVVGGMVIGSIVGVVGVVDSSKRVFIFLGTQGALIKMVPIGPVPIPR